MKGQKPGTSWIHGPLVDLGVIAFGWVPVYILFMAARFYWRAHFHCDVTTMWACPPDIQTIIIVTGTVTNIHRHYSLPFIYADHAEYNRHPGIYFWAPIVLICVVFPVCMYQLFPPGIPRNILYGTYTAISMLSAVWNLYHLLMQKFGFLRIYAGQKLGYGDPKLDRLLFFTWLAVVIVSETPAYARAFYEHIARNGFGWASVLMPAIIVTAKILIVPTALYAAYTTWRWGTLEWRHYTPASLPRLIFALSVGLICLTFVQSLLLGFIVFGFSHALEYIVFANLYAFRKYRGINEGPPMRYWARGAFLGPLLANLVIAGLVIGIYRGMAHTSIWGLALAYGLASSLLHFLYDGLLWKMSNPETRRYVLDLR